MAARKPKVDDPATPDVDESLLPDEPETTTEPDDPAGDPETTTDYTRRAGGYVLTQQGWVLEAEPSVGGS